MAMAKPLYTQKALVVDVAFQLQKVNLKRAALFYIVLASKPGLGGKVTHFLQSSVRIATGWSTRK